MKVARALLAAAALALSAPVPSHAATTHDVSVGNYFYRQDATGAETITITQGDRIKFTVVEPDYPPHSANIDEVGFRSGDMLVLDERTTPPIDKVGTFLLYCVAHQDRGHETVLTVRALPSKPKTKTGGGTAAGTSTPATRAGSSKAAKQLTASASPGVKESARGKAQATQNAVPDVAVGPLDGEGSGPDPETIRRLLGRPVGERRNWTIALRMAALLLLPIGAITGYAMRAEIRRARLAHTATAEADPEPPPEALRVVTLPEPVPAAAVPVARAPRSRAPAKTTTTTKTRSSSKPGAAVKRGTKR